jgi:hypothetical protein
VTTINQLQGDHVFEIAVLGQATAGTADEWSGVKIPYDATVVAAKWIPAAAVTADPTNYCNVNLRNRGAAGAGTTLPATKSYATGSSTAFAADDMTLSTDVDLTAGDVLTVSKTNTGTGLALPDGVVQVHVRWR